MSVDEKAGSGDYLRRSRGTPRAPVPMRRWLLLVFFGFLVYQFVFSSRGFISLNRLRRETKMLEERRGALAAELERLTAEEKRLKTAEGIEEAARERHGMARPGEEIYLLPAPEDSSSATPFTLPK
jgi:cell division protein FtsB